jgi:hypothetical protein
MKRRGFLASLFALPAAVKAASSELPKPAPRRGETRDRFVQVHPEPEWGEMGDTFTCITMVSACSVTSELYTADAARMLRTYKR